MCLLVVVCHTWNASKLGVAATADIFVLLVAGTCKECGGTRHMLSLLTCARARIYMSDLAACNRGMTA